VWVLYMVIQIQGIYSEEFPYQVAKNKASSVEPNKLYSSTEFSLFLPTRVQLARSFPIQLLSIYSDFVLFR
jgi:hypothetical protein